MDIKIFRISAKTHIHNLASSIYSHILSESEPIGASIELRAMGPVAISTAVKAIIKANMLLSANNQAITILPFYSKVDDNKEEDSKKFSVCFLATVKQIS